MEEYEKNKKNQEYQEARSNFQYLHEKLAHIRRMGREWDSLGELSALLHSVSFWSLGDETR